VREIEDHEKKLKFIIICDYLKDKIICPSLFYLPLTIVARERVPFVPAAAVNDPRPSSTSSTNSGLSFEYVARTSGGKGLS